jgi:hypothetical protein
MRRIFPLLLILGFAAVGFAQDVTHPAIGGFETQGSITAGYRFTDVAGRRQKFAELFSLRDGFRLHDVSVFSKASDDQRFADNISFFASGLGGEPFQGGQLRLSKSRLYDFRANYRQSYFYWDRNDNTNHPAGLNALTTNHDWATVRKIGSINLALYATNNLRFNVEAYRTNREGMSVTTRTLDYLGAPAFWGNFARANPYVIEAPVNQTANKFTGGFNYSFHAWNVAYRAGYQTDEEAVTMDNVGSGQRSINIDDPVTASERLDRASWLEFRRLKTPVSEFSYNGRAGSRLQLRGGYIFYRYRGPASLNASFNGTSRSNTGGTTFAPYGISVINRAELNEPNHIIDEGFSIDLGASLRFHTDYRYSRFNVDSIGSSRSVNNGAPVNAETELDWRVGTHILDTALEFAPGARLLLRPGIRLMKRDVTLLHDGIADQTASRRSKIAWPLLSVYFRPSETFTLRGDIQSITNGTPYTRISPRTNVSSRIVARVTPVANVTIENSLNVRNAEFETTDFRNTIRSNATSVSYTVNNKVALRGGFTYDSFLATNSVTFLRGVAPLDAVWRDQTVNRIWTGGIDARPLPTLGLNLSGNYVRTTGVGEISGEPPAFGPLRWPLVTGTLSYDFPGAGTLSIDLQRTYYIEQIMQGDNFSANILGIRWTKEF